MLIDVNSFSQEARGRFFQLMLQGDAVTLRRFTAAVSGADVDRCQPMTVRFSMTLPELVATRQDEQGSPVSLLDH